VQSSVGRVVDLASKTAGSSFDHPKSNGSVHRDPSTHNLYEPHGTSDRSLGTRTEKVLDSFLQSPILKNDEDIEVNEMVSIGRDIILSNYDASFLLHHKS